MIAVRRMVGRRAECEMYMSQNPLEDWVQRVTSASQTFVAQNDSHGWLLKQSIYTHFPRLATLLAMPWFQTLSGSVLDVGAGTGALSLDLAWRAGGNGHVTAVDRDAEALEIACALAERVGVKIATLPGEATALPVADASQDTIVARFVFQHLPEPLAALREMRRVARPGGRIAIFDVDDEVTISEPPEPECVVKLHEAIRVLQSQRGGNRLMGRELYRLMREAGLTNVQVIVIPRVRLGLQNGRSAEAEAYQIERLLREREALIDSGLMTAGEFEAAVVATHRGFSEDRFDMAAEFVATGYVPAA